MEYVLRSKSEVRMGAAAALILLVASLNLGVTTCSGEEFAARIVDGLGRPVQGVVVNIEWSNPVLEGKARVANLLRLRSDEDGMVHGAYDDKAMTAGGYPSVELSKEGYSGYARSGFDREYILRRQYDTVDLVRIANLDEKARTPAIREILAGTLEADLLERKVFELDDVFRSGLRDLIHDRRVGLTAVCLIAFIGVPEDLAWVARNTTTFKKNDSLEAFQPWAYNAWAYELVSAMLEPTTEGEWAFIKRCAQGEFDLLSEQAGAIEILRLIASPKSRQMLEFLRPEDPDLADFIAGAITYTESNPAPLTGRDVVQLGEKVATAFKFAKWQGNGTAYYNKRRDKVFIDLNFAEGRSFVTLRATFHKVAELWKLRGIRTRETGTLVEAVKQNDGR